MNGGIEFEKTFNCRSMLNPDERVVGMESGHTVPEHITVELVSYTDTSYTVRISGGEPGEVYSIPGPKIERRLPIPDGAGRADMNASDDLAMKASGYIWAASGSLAIAEQLMPDDHPESEKLAELLTQVAKMYERLADAR